MTDLQWYILRILDNLHFEATLSLSQVTLALTRYELDLILERIS